MRGQLNFFNNREQDTGFGALTRDYFLDSLDTDTHDGLSDLLRVFDKPAQIN
jgi:hypothetical protein